MAEGPLPDEIATQVALGNISLGQLAGLTTTHLRAIAALGQDMLGKGAFDMAERVFRGLIAAEPTQFIFRSYLAATLLAKGELVEALAEYNRVIEFNPKDLDARVGRADILVRAARVPEAVTDLEYTLQADPTAQHACTRKAKTLLATAQRLAAAKKPGP